MKRILVIAYLLTMPFLEATEALNDLESSQSECFEKLKATSDTAFGFLAEYLSRFDGLKEMENWREILSLGSQALSDPLITKKQVAKIHAQLASCSFYLGDYEGCAMHANRCLLISESLEDPSLLMRALYLLSAHKRAEGNTYAVSDPELAKQSFAEALSLIDKAIEHFDHCHDDFTKAKVLFNAGAAHSDDPQGDLELAVKRYQEAIDMYSLLGEYDDYARTSIRLGKVFLLQNRYGDLQEVLEKIELTLLPKKTKVHYQYLEAQYYAAIEERAKAQSILLNAIKQAEALGMEADLNRLHTLLQSLE